MTEALPEVGSDERYLVQPVLKALQVLRLVCRAEGPVTLNRLVQEAALPKTTVFRYLRTLAAMDLVQHDSTNDHYAPGLGLWRLAQTAGPSERLKHVCRPHMKRLRARFGETVNLGVLSGGEVLYLDVLESERSLRMQSTIGATDPLHSTALGKVLLAFSPPRQRALLIPPRLERRTPATITDRAALEEQLSIIRTTGHAIEIGENEEGSYCIAAPIPDASGNAIAAISLSAPISRYDETARQAICAALMSAGAELGALIAGPAAEPLARAG